MGFHCICDCDAFDRDLWSIWKHGNNVGLHQKWLGKSIRSNNCKDFDVRFFIRFTRNIVIEKFTLYFHQLHNDFNRMLMNLIFAELINCSYGISLDITAAMQYGWKLGPTVCHTTGFLLTLCGKWILLDFNYKSKAYKV